MVNALFPRIKEKAELTFLKPPIDVTCELISTDKDGKVIGRRKFRSHSFVSNFLAVMYSQLVSASTSTVITTGKDITGTTRSLKTTSTAGNENPGGAVQGTGAQISVGTGSTAPAPADNAMGGFAGRVTGTITQPLVSGSTTKITITGTVTFATATTINEVGVEQPLTYDAASTLNAAFLMIHDNVSGGFAVSAGGAITVVYTISVTT